jgi:ribosomal protein L11 methyltransferase
VLAIAAVLLGAASVLGLDVDPVAIGVAEANCRENGVGDRVELRKGTLEEGAEDTFDIVVANISTPANLHLLPAYAAALQPGGRLLLSGILDVDAPRFLEAAPSLVLRHEETAVDRDWCFLAFMRE